MFQLAFLTIVVVVAFIAGRAIGHHEAREVDAHRNDYETRTDLKPEDAALREVLRIDRETSDEL